MNSPGDPAIAIAVAADATERREGWLVLALIYGFGMAAAAAMGMMGPLVGDVARDLRVPVGVAGGALLFQIMPGALAGSLIGSLIDRLGARKTLLAAAVVLVATDLIQTIASSLPWFCADLLVQGVAINAVLSSAQVMVTASSSGARQTRDLTIWSTVNFVGYAAGLLLAATSAGGAQWRHAFLYHAAITALLPILGLGLPVVKATVAKADLLGVLKETRVVRISLALGLASIAGLGVNASSSLYLHQAQGVPLSLSATVAAAGNLISITGSFIAGWLLAKGTAPGRLAAAICLLATVCGIVLYFPRSGVATAVAMLFTYQCCASGIVALTYSAMPKVLVDKARIGAATGLLVQISGIGAMLGAPVFFTVLATNQWLLLSVTLLALWAGALAVMPFPILGRRTS